MTDPKTIPATGQRCPTCDWPGYDDLRTEIGRLRAALEDTTYPLGEIDELMKKIASLQASLSETTADLTSCMNNYQQIVRVYGGALAGITNYADGRNLGGKEAEHMVALALAGLRGHAATVAD